ncbi:hypothetical protein GTY79_33560 [Streptomyces sp. SID8385]|nr:hypothetical protein [Streptomyces sp. SID8385]MYX83105.1 hypothetical protein [Streptomyces sp. SID4915]
MFDSDGVGVFRGMDVGKTARHGHGSPRPGPRHSDTPRFTAPRGFLRREQS